MIKAVIIEDEKKGQEALLKLISENCPEISILDIATSVSSGLVSILKHEPELVFLDINMPDGEGFDILQLIKDRQFDVIFTTAFNHYASKAFDFAALHYLLKPIGALDLLNAVKRFNRSTGNKTASQHYEILNNSLQNRYDKIAIPTLDGVSFVKLDEIIRCEAEQSYTVFYFIDQKKLVTSKSMGKYEALLTDLGFFRVHDKHIVNLKHVCKYTKGAGGELTMIDNSIIPVSTRKKTVFLQAIKEFIHSY